MEVVLLQNVAQIGKKGEVKNVKDGFYLNFLAPRKLAKLADNQDKINFKHREAKKIEDVENSLKQAKELKEKLQGLKIVIKGKAKGKNLYAAIGADQVIAAVVDSAKIRLNANNLPAKLHLKEVGEHEISVKLAGGIVAKIDIMIEAQEV